MGRTPDSWKKKVHPVFCEIAAVCRALAAAQKQPQRGKRAGEVRKVLNLSLQKRQELLTDHPGNSPGTPWQQVTATGYKPPSTQEKLEQVLDWFFFKRNRTPRWLALEKEKEGDSGSALAAYFAAPIQEASAAGTRPRGDPQHNGTTDPGLVLVATQDCHKSKQINSFTLYARYPIYSLRLPTNPAQKPQCNGGIGQCYTVFEFIPQNKTACGVGGFTNLSPCSYANGTAQYPYNEFDDEISTGLYGSSFNKTQYFDYGLPNQRLFGVKQIYMTLPNGSLQRKQPNASFNQLHADPQADPLIDGQVDPWLAPWDGTPASCDSAFSLYFP
jgi:hypothetical protein